MKWMEALKKFNAGKGEWCVPKKGTREHAEVISIMQGNTVYTSTRQEQTEHLLELNNQLVVVQSNNNILFEY
jgi:hypothetical protein